LLSQLSFTCIGDTIVMPKQGDWDGLSFCLPGCQAQHGLGPKRLQHLGVAAASTSRVGEAKCRPAFVVAAAAAGAAAASVAE